MNGSVFVKIMSFLLCLAQHVELIQGGICWSVTSRQGRCTDILSEKMTKEECCRQFANVNTAWSKEDMEAGRLFFLRVLGGGVPCQSCKESCSEVKCEPGKKCVFKSGRPKCVCSPCREKGKNFKGPVCGTDGNTYLNACRIKKRACRKKSANLSVAYHGFCQSSCDRIRCPKGKYCLLDQNLSPHCVRCTIKCPRSSKYSKPVCGSDGVTYGSVCHLRQTACTKGKAIPIAYKGQCKVKATCGSVHCKNHQACLTDASSGLPRCVTCTTRCSSAISKQLGGPICASNNKTYQSWCHMLKDACAMGFVLETKYMGTCEKETESIELESTNVTTSLARFSTRFFSEMPSF